MDERIVEDAVGIKLDNSDVHGCNPSPIATGHTTVDAIDGSSLTDLSPDLTPIRNRYLDRERVVKALQDSCVEPSINERRRDTI